MRSSHHFAEPQRFALHAMATRFELAIHATFDAGSAAQAALEEIALAHRQLSRFERASLVSHLRRTCHQAPARLEPDVLELFRTALRVERATDGAFSPTPERPWSLRVEQDRLTSRSHEPPVDLGAIAKGYALDQAARVLRESGIEKALLHGGTSTVLAVGGPFRIGLANASPSSDAPSIELSDRALSVSAQNRRDDPTDRFHIVDARSARPATGAVQSLALAPRAMLADAWSTAALALHPALPASDRLSEDEVELRTFSLRNPSLPCSDPIDAIS